MVPPAFEAILSMSTDTIPELPSQIVQHRALVEQALENYLNFGLDCPAQLREAMAYMLLSGGKRIRPVLTLCAAEACGGNIQTAIPAACAVEMIHTYSLIHDDLPSMDDDEFRRGQLTCHLKFDEATAILAGDALQARAFELLAECPAESVGPSVAVLAWASGPNNLVGGQVDDLAGCHESPSLEKLQHIHRRKTAALLIASLKLGGISAGTTPENLNRLEKYGEKLGLAFQIVDDLLDFDGDPSRMGKQSGKDLENGTMTFPGFLGPARSREMAAQLIAEAIQEIQPFGDAANNLQGIAKFVLNRDF